LRIHRLLFVTCLHGNFFQQCFTGNVHAVIVQYLLPCLLAPFRILLNIGNGFALQSFNDMITEFSLYRFADITVLGQGKCCIFKGGIISSYTKLGHFAAGLPANIVAAVLFGKLFKIRALLQGIIYGIG
jgi:hypothetical protein